MYKAKKQLIRASSAKGPLRWTKAWEPGGLVHLLSGTMESWRVRRTWRPGAPAVRDNGEFAVTQEAKRDSAILLLDWRREPLDTCQPGLKSRLCSTQLPANTYPWGQKMAGVVPYHLPSRNEIQSHWGHLGSEHRMGDIPLFLPFKLINLKCCTWLSSY